MRWPCSRRCSRAGRSISRSWTTEFRSSSARRSGVRPSTGKRLLPGGLTEAVAADPRLARLYIGLAAPDPETARQLVRDFGLRMLADDYANLLVLYSSALTMVTAMPWFPAASGPSRSGRELVGVSPADAKGIFLRAPATRWRQAACLLCRPDAARSAPAEVFYRIAPPDDKVPRSVQCPSRNTGTPFLRDANAWPSWTSVPLPISPDGRVVFPGGSRSGWLQPGVQNGPGPTEASAVSPAITSPEAEEKILLRLARSGSGMKRRICRRLPVYWPSPGSMLTGEEPLEEASASPAGPGVCEAPVDLALPGIPYRAGNRRICRHWCVSIGDSGDFDTLTRNDALGEWDALAKIICLLAESDTLTEEKAAQFFRLLCDSVHPCGIALRSSRSRRSRRSVRC